MKAVPFRLVTPGPGETEQALDAFTLALGRLASHPPPPPVLIGDLLLALARSRPAVRHDDQLPEYSDFLRQLTRSRRWGFVAMRLGQLARGARSGAIRNNLTAYVVESVVTSLWATAAEALQNESAEEALLEKAAGAYRATADPDDFAVLLLDDLAMALIELSRRARSLDFRQLLQPKELVRACLEAPFDTNAYRPRLLCDVMREGDRAPRLPGEHQDLRAITLKVREDQIPRILPSELASNLWRGRQGRALTLDKVINRSPAIRQHHETQRPELDHRILIVFLMGVTRHPEAAVADVAETNAKALGFSLLANAALKVPHQAIDADVAWFQRDDPDAPSFQWAVQFRLGALSITAAEGERWRNVVEIDRRLPRLLVTTGGGVELSSMTEYSLIKEHPLDYLTRASQGRYHGVFVVGIAPPGEAAGLAPNPSLALPALPPGVPPVLLITSGPDARRGLRGATFPSLLAARMAPALLPPPPPESDPALFFIEEFLKMIVGPIERRAGARRPGALEVAS